MDTYLYMCKVLMHTMPLPTAYTSTHTYKYMYRKKAYPTCTCSWFCTSFCWIQDNFSSLIKLHVLLPCLLHCTLQQKKLWVLLVAPIFTMYVHVRLHAWGDLCSNTLLIGDLYTCTCMHLILTCNIQHCTHVLHTCTCMYM